MRLSIIIPVYNVISYLEETLKAILCQTFTEFELILVDDGSTDGSGELCDQFAAKDSRIRVIHQPNSGVSTARNAGVAAAKGDYIGFTDSDDVIEQDMFAVMMELAQKHNADIVQCQHDRSDLLNGAPRTDKIDCIDGPAFVRRIFTCTGGTYTNQVALWSKIYRRALFEGIVFPVGQTYEDEQETYKLCLKAKKIVETQNVLYHYIKRENSIITGISPRKMLDKQAALLDRLHYLPERLPELTGKCAESFYGFSAHILTELYRQNEKDAYRTAKKRLGRRRKTLLPYLDRYGKLYLYWLSVPGLEQWLMKADFEPIQKLVGGLRRT